MASYPAYYGAASFWHLLPLGASWRTRRIPCHETSYYHRHKTHEETYTSALCGIKVLEEEGNFCNIGFFLDGFRPNQPLCSECREFADKRLERQPAPA